MDQMNANRIVGNETAFKPQLVNTVEALNDSNRIQIESADSSVKDDQIRIQKKSSSDSFVNEPSRKDRKKAKSNKSTEGATQPSNLKKSKVNLLLFYKTCIN